MGTRDRSWLSGLLRRNTVKRVIQNSPCPVMVLRAGITGSGVTRNSRNGSSFIRAITKIAGSDAGGIADAAKMCPSRQFTQGLEFALPEGMPGKHGLGAVGELSA
jgi:hypothetical protein